MIVIGRPCGSVAQWSECSHDIREVLGSSPGRAITGWITSLDCCAEINTQDIADDPNEFNDL